MISLENETSIELDIDYEKVAEQVVTHILRSLKCPFDTDISIILTDNEGIHEINREQRSIDAPTDVLSFPYLDYENAGVFPDITDDYTCIDPETGSVYLGDIVISLEKIVSQAEEFGHSCLREYGFLIAHSVLHLCGYDHMDDEERKVMEALQDKLLNEIGIVREVG